LTVTVMTSVCVVVAPEAGLMLSHEADTLAVQFSVPCPVLVMLKVCDFEVTAPSIIMNEKGSGVSCMIGCGVGGGGYLRIYPLWLTKRLVRRLNTHEGEPAVFYLHPWELDPEQPRQPVGAIQPLRHYYNLNSTHVKADFSL